MKNINLYFLGIIGFGAIGCNQEPQPKKEWPIIGGKCIYENNFTYVHVSSYEKNDQDSITKVVFSIKDNILNEKMVFTSEEILHVGRKILDKETIEDSSLYFEVEYEEIKEGGCENYNVMSVKKMKSNKSHIQ